MTTHIERALQTEIMYRLNRYPVIAVPVPNGSWIAPRGDEEHRIAGRLVARAKADGMLLPGAPDVIILGARGGLCCELKRPASRDLFGRRPKGRLSPDQAAFRDRCEAAGVPYVLAYCWDDVATHLPDIAA
jgi:hypothetical protein